MKDKMEPKKEKNGLLEWKNCSDAQKEQIAVWFKEYCSGMKCLNMDCRNSPNDILDCPLFNQWVMKKLQLEARI
jgi:hypothetical protein